MKELIFYAVGWLVGTHALLPLSTECADSKLFVKKRSTSCENFKPQNISANDLFEKRTRNAVCSNTVLSSSCYLCEKKETPRNSFFFKTTLVRISNNLRRVKNINLYGKVIYDTTEYVICNMTTTVVDDARPIYIWELHFTCKRLTSLDDDDLPSSCSRKTLNSGVCSIECSDGQSSINCPQMATTLSTMRMESTRSTKGTNGREETQNNNETLAGGVVGGVLGGVVITVVVVVVWWICRRKRSQGDEDDQGMRDSHIYLPLTPGGGSNSNATQPADNTATIELNDTSHNTGYYRSEDIVVPNKYAEDRQGEYVDIKDEELDEICGLSSSTTTPNTVFSNDQGSTAADTQKKEKTLDTYDRLRRQNSDSHPLPVTWIRFDDTGITQVAATQLDLEDSSASYCVLEDNESKGTYNKLRSELEPSDKQLDTYNRLEDKDTKEKISDDMMPEYFVLENLGPS